MKKIINNTLHLQVKVDGVKCENSLILVNANDTTVEDMKITLQCDKVGRVVSFEIPPNPKEVVMLTLCEVDVFGYETSGFAITFHYFN